ncbi:DMT family transporter [Aeromonas taiwanensis]|uniref:DMT family transporter n=1 Tax=Aeromonas taiwanensis TaxID=633417 RepID=A0A5F0KDX6_9GAMM|nr:DMT family transporter [Aeromonas taiwanensis]TFF78439.1 DMT family transporter [Aeromonas taiwanensis]TFF78989.1 DMT family transporter [Aeromonas taiwanensis]TFF82499.1 DMT family transporter [Aeromonas taiwanensis]
MGYEWLALAAASLWAIAALISVKPARHLGAFAYSRWRMFLVCLMLAGASLATGGWQTLTESALPLLALSGLVGIFVGDTALFACMNRLGPRRSGLLFSCHALFSALLGLWLFGEHLGGWRLLGALLVLAGVMLAILFGRRGNNQQSEWEQVRGSLVVGIALGLTAALCQSLGAIIAKPVMMSGDVDAVSASGIRMGSALLAHCALRVVRLPLAMPHNPINRQVLGMIGINGFLAMALGMTLILVALRQGDVGMVAILSSTTPVILLPLLWWHSGMRPSLPAWTGALLATLGTALVLGAG